jgi:RND family efflux transporter MFP subunit
MYQVPPAIKQLKISGDNGMKLAGILGISTLITIVMVTANSDALAQSVTMLPSHVAPSSEMSSFEGVVEAERQTVIAAQVSGAILEIAIKAGDRVKAGQLLIRIDAHAATQSAAASKAQVSSAQAALELAKKEFDRQQQLFAQDYLSQAALDRAESRFKVAEAEAHAQIAQARLAETQTGFYTIRAPYAGVIAEIPVSLGYMAMPGQPLMSLYDPAALRVTSTIPQSVVVHGMSASIIKIELSGQPAKQMLSPTHIKIMPTVDAATHTAQIRLMLPTKLQDVVPGMFARVWLPTREQSIQSVKIPLTALVRRSEMTGVYVLDSNNQPLLRQVRIGRQSGGQVEILSGIGPGEHVVQDAESALATPAH